MDSELLEQLKKIVKEKYNKEHCALTEECSQGNDMDVFNDGYSCGVSNLAYEIGQLLGMDLEEPSEQVYSWEE